MKVSSIKKKLYKRFFIYYKKNRKMNKDIIASFKRGLLKSTIDDSKLK